MIQPFGSRSAKGDGHVGWCVGSLRVSSSLVKSFMARNVPIILVGAPS